MQKSIRATAKVRASYAPSTQYPAPCALHPALCSPRIFVPAAQALPRVLLPPCFRVCVGVWVCGCVSVLHVCERLQYILCIVLLIPQNLEPIGACNPRPSLFVSRCIPPPSFVLLFKTQESSKHEITTSLSPKIILQSSWTMKCCLTKPNVTICLWTRMCKCLWNVATGLSRTRYPSWGGCANARGQTATGSGDG